MSTETRARRAIWATEVSAYPRVVNSRCAAESTRRRVRAAAACLAVASYRRLLSVVLTGSTVPIFVRSQFG